MCVVELDYLCKIRQGQGHNVFNLFSFRRLYSNSPNHAGGWESYEIILMTFFTPTLITTLMLTKYDPNWVQCYIRIKQAHNDYFKSTQKHKNAKTHTQKQVKLIFFPEAKTPTKLRFQLTQQPNQHIRESAI